jgi:hypothetical protein
MVGAIESLGKSRCSNSSGQSFGAFGFIGSRNLFERENGQVRAFRDTRATVDAGIRVDVKPGPFFNRFTRDYTFHWTNRRATAIPQTHIGDRVSQCSLQFKRGYAV